MRRRLLSLCGLLVVLAICGPVEAGRRRPVQGAAEARAQHVLGRAGYGPDAWSRGRIEALGATGYLQEQLAPETIDDGALESQLVQFPSLALDLPELWAIYGDEGSQLHPGNVLSDLQQARILRAVASRRQLHEVLVDFWFNHFNVYTELNSILIDVSPYERTAIRPHVLGRFGDMLLAVARSPAMAMYLDNDENEVGALVENWARELLELHTLGVGNFTEADMVEVARCFTGWKRDYTQTDGFRFDAALHDQGAKSLFGGALQIPADGGYQDGVAVLEFLASRPETARHIARKLIVRFVTEEPLPVLVDDLAQVFLATDGDLGAVTETLLLSPAFLDGFRGARVKRPLHLMTSAARAMGTAPAQLDLFGISERIRFMGEELFRARPPTGYPDVAAAWAGPGTVLLRFNTMEVISRGMHGYAFAHPPATTVEELVDALAAQYFVADLGAEERAGAIAFLTGLGLPPDADDMAEQASAYLLSIRTFQQH